MIVIGLIIAFLVVSSAFVSSSQTALLSLSGMEVNTWKTSHEPRKKLVAALVLRPRELLVTLFMLDIFINLLIQNVFSSYFGPAASWALRVGLPLLITLFMGEVIPKSIGFAHNKKIAYVVAPAISLITRLIKPVRYVLTIITSYVSRFIFFFLKKPADISRAELHHLLKSQAVSSLLTSEEAELIDGYLTLQDASVKEHMWPREDVIYYSLEEPLTKLLYLFIEEDCSQIPVCGKDLNDLHGVITARQFFLYQDQINKPEDLKPFLANAFFVPETMKARSLMRQFQRKKESLAMVVDEYGGIAGLIAYEDLVEAIVGDIQDLRNKKSLYTMGGPKIIIASSKLELSTFKDIFHYTLKSSMKTLGGFLIEQFGDIPKVGQQIVKEGFLFQILASEPQRIKRIYVKRL